MPTPWTSCCPRRCASCSIRWPCIRWPRPRPKSAIADDGLALRVPGIGAEPAWEARFPGDGQRLFTRRDAEVASAVRAVLDRVAAYQVAVERGIEQERARVAQDLHDDIGARLLTLLHRSEGEAAQAIREVLASLRLTVYGLGARPQPIGNCLAHWRAEAGERCEALGVRLDWTERALLATALLDAPQQLNLARVLREALSNALRHARPSAHRRRRRHCRTGARNHPGQRWRDPAAGAVAQRPGPARHGSADAAPGR